MTEYAERDPEQLDKDGGYYFRHVMAMTSEKLHSKADIAAELAFRDKRIAELNERVEWYRQNHPELAVKYDFLTTRIRELETILSNFEGQP
jgi:hypothetical protein